MSALLPPTTVRVHTGTSYRPLLKPAFQEDTGARRRISHLTTLEQSNLNCVFFLLVCKKTLLMIV